MQIFQPTTAPLSGAQRRPEPGIDRGSEIHGLLARGWSHVLYSLLALFAFAVALAAPAAASVVVSPASAAVTPGKSIQFQYTAGNGLNTTGADITWMVWPQVGSVTASGLYTAPASVTTATSVKVVVLIVPALSVQPPQVGFATLSLTPPVSVSVTPAASSLSAGQSQQFTASIANSSNTSVSWSISPSVGSISVQGLYTAPVSISSAQTVSITATSAADNTKHAVATVTLKPSVSISLTPLTATLSASQTGQFYATVSNSSNTAVTWSLSPAFGTLSASGLYTAPQTVASAQTVTVTATSQADTTKSASATITVNPGAQAVTMPIEVMGTSSTIKTVNVNVPSSTGLSGNVTLTAQLHGLEYESQASVQVNGGSWIGVTSSAATGLGKQYGAIGGGFNTLEFSIALPAGSVQAGANSIAFRFNGTDGNSSGYRVLAFNLQTADGTQLLPASNFVQDNPSAWTAPMTDAADIAAGQNLWRTATLSQPNATGGSKAILAHCGDCHTQDGRDLKYFNYSNNAIYVRSAFHGLNDTQANQIVSYIRSLATPAPSQARPWNPPYQPGPGSDAQPVANWAAGAGLDAVLTSDAAMQSYMAPGGNTTGWAANQYLNTRELPVALQLPDWNHWLPTVHPMDAFGSSFTNSGFNGAYQQLRSDLAPADAAAYSYALQSGDYVNWFIGQGNFLGPIEQNANWNQNNLRTKVFSAALWQMVKLWELNQEFGLEGMAQVPFGSKAQSRAWYGPQAFNTSPNMLHISAGPGIGNGTSGAQTYIAYIWYHVQLVLNDGNGQEQGQNPIDYPYVQGYMATLNQIGDNAPEGMLQLMWTIKALQEETLTGAGPDQGSSGWSPTYTNPEPLVDDYYQPGWGGVSGATHGSVTQAYAQQWLTQLLKFTPQQFYTGGWANPADDPHQLSSQVTFGGSVWYMLPRLRFYGVSPSLTYQISAWAATVWPKGNWASNNNATCTATPGVHCTTD